MMLMLHPEDYGPRRDKDFSATHYEVNLSMQALLPFISLPEDRIDWSWGFPQLFSCKFETVAVEWSDIDVADSCLLVGKFDTSYMPNLSLSLTDDFNSFFNNFVSFFIAFAGTPSEDLTLHSLPRHHHLGPCVDPLVLMYPSSDLSLRRRNC